MQSAIQIEVVVIPGRRICLCENVKGVEDEDIVDYNRNYMG